MFGNSSRASRRRSRRWRRRDRRSWALSRSWGDPLPAWNLLSQGQGTYAALYPFGWISYNAFNTDISMRFYSPMVAGEDRRTSLPLAYFDLRVANHTNATADVSVMFTWPNVAESVDGAAPTVRTGLSDSAATDRRTGVTSVTLSADDPSNTPDAYASEWTIAARPAAGQTVSYVPSWDGNGDGSDIYDAFSGTGVLPARRSTIPRRLARSPSRRPCGLVRRRSCRSR